jgi:ABC-type transporter MlaC component
MPKDDKSKGTWIIKLTDEQAIMVEKAFEASAEKFYSNILEEMKGKPASEVAAVLADKDTTPPNKHEWATKLFLDGLAKSNS